MIDVDTAFESSERFCSRASRRGSEVQQKVLSSDVQSLMSLVESILEETRQLKGKI